MPCGRRDRSSARCRHRSGRSDRRLEPGPGRPARRPQAARGQAIPARRERDRAGRSSRQTARDLRRPRIDRHSPRHDRTIPLPRPRRATPPARPCARDLASGNARWAAGGSTRLSGSAPLWLCFCPSKPRGTGSDPLGRSWTGRPDGLGGRAARAVATEASVKCDGSQCESRPSGSGDAGGRGEHLRRRIAVPGRDSAGPSRRSALGRRNQAARRFDPDGASGGRGLGRFNPAGLCGRRGRLGFVPAQAPRLRAIRLFVHNLWGDTGR